MWARYAFQKPRTEASVARVRVLLASEPPISRTPSRSDAPTTPRYTIPPTQPSSKDT